LGKEEKNAWGQICFFESQRGDSAGRDVHCFAQREKRGSCVHTFSDQKGLEEREKKRCRRRVEPREKSKETPAQSNFQTGMEENGDAREKLFKRAVRLPNHLSEPERKKIGVPREILA